MTYETYVLDMTEAQWVGWIDALTSEKYQQGVARLRTVYGPSAADAAFCCLGVFCETIGVDLSAPVGILADAGFAPRGWSLGDLEGVEHGPQELLVAIPRSVRDRLAQMNDNGRSFSGIASWLVEEREAGRIRLLDPRAGDIGEPVRRREYEPLPEAVPVPEPAPVPAEPVPA